MIQLDCSRGSYLSHFLQRGYAASGSVISLTSPFTDTGARKPAIAGCKSCGHRCIKRYWQLLNFCSPVSTFGCVCSLAVWVFVIASSALQIIILPQRFMVNRVAKGLKSMLINRGIEWIGREAGCMLAATVCGL